MRVAMESWPPATRSPPPPGRRTLITLACDSARILRCYFLNLPVPLVGLPAPGRPLTHFKVVHIYMNQKTNMLWGNVQK